MFKKLNILVLLGLVLVFLTAISSSAQEKLNISKATSSQNQGHHKYIINYAPIAVKEMYRSGVPASITLAQGILESSSGRSVLAVKGNNHFGIKCHNNWTGRRIYHNDDKIGECFRVYDNAEQSFRDHSDFLRYKDRYKFLFEFETSDYEAWAYGLRKAGYASDRSYPQKLIKLIKEYKLYEYDKMKIEDLFVLEKQSVAHKAEGVEEEKAPEVAKSATEAVSSEEGEVGDAVESESEEALEEPESETISDKVSEKAESKAVEKEEVPESKNHLFAYVGSKSRDERESSLNKQNEDFGGNKLDREILKKVKEDIDSRGEQNRRKEKNNKSPKNSRTSFGIKANKGEHRGVDSYVTRDDRPEVLVGSNKNLKPTKKGNRRSKKIEIIYKIPSSPLSIEEPKILSRELLDEFKFSLSRRLYSKNGVPFLYSAEGETYKSIAKQYRLFLFEILSYNDLKSAVDLQPGTIVYLKPKKKTAPYNLDKYIVSSDNEKLRDICQRFGVKMSYIKKINKFNSTYSPKEGDTILLREEAEEKLYLPYEYEKDISYE